MGFAEGLAAALSGRYTVERELGAGGMATVYLARDLRHDRAVAIKVLRSDIAAVLGAERFLREIRISAALDHPHILTLIDSGQAGGLLYYVLPYVRGESLRARLEREGQLPLADALAITRQVAGALDYAHQRGIVHRDIKPENILLHEGEAVVADFGIALALSEAGGDRLTATGHSIGTPQYMSPEQATGDHATDARSDVYSLGAVLYEMLAGEPPHSARSSRALIAKVLTERPTQLRVLRDGVPDAVDAAVMRALAKTPADRFATARAFADSLVGPVASSRSAAAPRWRPRVVALAALAVVLVAGGVWGARALLGPAATAGPDPRRVAVLYFRPAPDSLASLADGLTEGLIRALAGAPALQVTSSNGTLPYRAAPAPPDSVGRALGVGSIVEGGVTQTANRLRVSVSLVDPANASVIASTAIDRPAAEVLALQDSVVGAVAGFLRRRLGEEIATREDRRRTRSVEAWRLVQDARAAVRDAAALVAAGDSAAAWRRHRRADSLLVRARALDRDWGTPLVERARLTHLALDIVGGFDPRHVAEWTGRGIEHLDAALAVQPDDPDALTERGIFRYYRSILNIGATPQAVAALGDSAEADMRAAVAADPGQADAWATLSHRLMRRNETAEAKLAALRAYEADPYVPQAAAIVWRLYAASLDLEDRQEATRWCDEGNRRFAGSAVFIECQITVQALAGQRPDVPAMWRLLEANVQAYPPNQRDYRRRRGQLLVAMTLVRAGLPDSARAVALRARGDATIDPSRDLVMVELLLRNVLGDREEALRLAAQYYAANPGERVDCGSGAAVDRTWWMRGLVDDPRYRAISCRGR